jgi:hypothetical protein
MTEPPSARRPDDAQPPGTDADHDASDFAAGGYDDRQESGDDSPSESHAREVANSEATRGTTDSPQAPSTSSTQHGGREPTRPADDIDDTDAFDPTP